MSFLAVLVLAAFSIRQIAVTLLPDIDIPTIRILVHYPDHSASDIEQSILAPLRQNIQQVAGIEDVETNASDEQGRLTALFPYGKNMDLAFVEVNEKLDRAINSLPDDLDRPTVVKTKASDIPALYLTIQYKDSLEARSGMIAMSEFAAKTVRRRLEQLPSVSIADITGVRSSRIVLIPDEDKMQSLGITHQDLRQAIRQANITLGNIRIRERKYEYLIRVGRPMNSIRDLKETPLKVRGRVFVLRELADIRQTEAPPEGIFINDGFPAVNLALFKDYDARMSVFEEEVTDVIRDLEESQSDIRFQFNRNQARLLDLSIRGMGTALWAGSLLATLIVFFFYRDRRIPVIIGIVTPLSLAISILFLYLAGLSVNIISLSGIILGIGMMIDNGIIILDNIAQESLQGATTEDACIRGTNEMILPLLASMLTTCAVFLPLIFLSDLAGALFYDQALSVTICLVVSYIVSVIFIPVLYFRLFLKKPIRSNGKDGRPNPIRRAYDRGFYFTFERSGLFFLAVFLVVGGGILAYIQLDKKTMPFLPRQSFQVEIAWNRPLPLHQMEEIIQQLWTEIDTTTTEFQAYLGPQDFLMNNQYLLDNESTILYISFENGQDRSILEEQISHFFESAFPQTGLTFTEDKDLFEVIFPSRTEPAYIAFYHNRMSDEAIMDAHRSLQQDWSKQYGIHLTGEPATEEVVVLKTLDENLLRYGVEKEYVLEVISRRINQLELASIQQLDREIPIVLTGQQTGLDQLFGPIRVLSRSGESLPLSYFIQTSTQRRLKYIHADYRGPYIPEQLRSEHTGLIGEAIHERQKQHPGEHFEIHSPEQKSRALAHEIVLAMTIALLLLYLIIAAQFESLLTPLIIILEIPVSLAGALIALWLSGLSINAMSLIGMVVTTGIIINDSIIKIDTIHRLHRAGMALKSAIHTGGQKRLYPIIMTSLTTILAMTPYLFGNSLGVVLQRPLAMSLIGSMLVGTLVSLFLIPKLYYWMNIKRTFLFGLCVLAFTGGTATAQDNRADTLFLTSDDLVQIALSSSPELELANIQYAIAGLRYDRFETFLKPGLHLNAQIPILNRAINVLNQPDGRQEFISQSTMRNRIAASLEYQMASTGGRVYVSSSLERLDIFKTKSLGYSKSYFFTPLTVGIEQPLFQFNALKWQKEILQQQEEQTDAQRVLQQESVVFEIVNGFYNLELIRRRQELIRNKITDARSLIAIKKQLFERGQGSLVEMKQLALDTLQSGIQYRSIELEYQKQNRVLVDIAGLDQQHHLVPVSPAEMKLPFIDLGTAINQGLRHKARTAGIRLRLALAERDIEEAGKDRGVALDISASIGVNNTAETFLGLQYNFLDRELLSVGLRMPITDWGRREINRQLASQQLNQLQKDLEIEERNITRQITDFYDQYLYLQEKIKVDEQALQTAEEVYAMIRDQYLRGQADWVNLNQNRSALDNATLAYYQTRMEAVTLYYQIRSLTLYDFENNEELLLDQ